MKKNILYTIITITLLMSIAHSCTTLKHKRTAKQQTEAYYSEQLGALSRRMQSIEKLASHENLRQQTEIFEITSDSLLFWHPDSGLQLRPGSLQLKYKVAGIKRYIRAQHIIHKEQENRDSISHREKTQITEQKLAAKDTEREINYRWVLMVVATLLGFLFLTGLSRKS